ncbi:hypothetical protein GQ53DRAFT_440235 [Thozetella sp. PMI_491]|nr:hypothetical protein GQ53DRAFT_440235 [Thozetella sp. PMI_491]
MLQHPARTVVSARLSRPWNLHQAQGAILIRHFRPPSTKRDGPYHDFFSEVEKDQEQEARRPRMIRDRWRLKGKSSRPTGSSVNGLPLRRRAFDHFGEPKGGVSERRGQPERTLLQKEEFQHRKRVGLRASLSKPFESATVLRRLQMSAGRAERDTVRLKAVLAAKRMVKSEREILSKETESQDSEAVNHSHASVEAQAPLNRKARRRLNLIALEKERLAKELGVDPDSAEPHEELDKRLGQYVENRDARTARVEARKQERKMLRSSTSKRKVVTSSQNQQDEEA